MVANDLKGIKVNFLGRLLGQGVTISFFIFFDKNTSKYCCL